LFIMTVCLFWFRYDLRIYDNNAFAHACKTYDTVIPVYIFDKATSVLGDAQCWWLHHSLDALDKSLKKHGLTLILRQGTPTTIINQLIKHCSINAIFWNRHYEPLTLKQDTKIRQAVSCQDVDIFEHNDCFLNQPEAVKNQQGTYFKVFAPYWKYCLKTLSSSPVLTIPSRLKRALIKSEDLSSWQLLPTHPNWAENFDKYWQPGELGAQKKLDIFIENNLIQYDKTRNYPALQATSMLSPHLHFGEISPHTILRAIDKIETHKHSIVSAKDRFLLEVGWREFSNYLLFHCNNLSQENYKEVFNFFPWSNDKKALQCWQEGRTGYPIVDAGMRQLWTMGYMHNRLRMIVASFLVKHLLIDWRLGAQWFLNTLVDADLGNNSVNWQWVAGSGIDASPFFQLFNPTTQSQRFDPKGIYIRRWVPELATIDNKSIHAPWATSMAENIEYPKPIVVHQEARSRALNCYSDARNHHKK
jgi:deoxyribodipyrimidine photo-lyase